MKACVSMLVGNAPCFFKTNNYSNVITVSLRSSRGGVVLAGSAVLSGPALEQQEVD